MYQYLTLNQNSNFDLIPESIVKKMKDKAKDFKAAEGEAKEKIKDELKAMTAEKKKLEKSI